MMANIQNFNYYVLSLMCKVITKNRLNNLFFVIILFFLPVLVSCETQTSVETISLITAVGNPKGYTLNENQSITNNPVTIFIGNDIQWFDPDTREIKLKKDVNINDFQTYQKIHFKLDNEYLFTAQTYTSQHHSFIIKDLVFFIDLFTKKCYLHDCYPLNIAKNDAETQANKEKRHDAWSSFLMQLKTENKIR